MRTEIRRLRDASEAEVCARMMADSEPWITLRRDYNASLEIMSDPMREVYVALVDAEIVGFVVLLMHGVFVGYVQSVGVAPQWRGRGIGTRLVAFAERRIFGDAPNVFITVSSFNMGAQRLYERLGYEVVGELEGFIIPGHSELLFRKTIGPLTEFTKD
ncbi:MAG: GNAT family N-acetyltransferase [Anaerolineae bacterium]